MNFITQKQRAHLHIFLAFMIYFFDNNCHFKTSTYKSASRYENCCFTEIYIYIKKIVSKRIFKTKSNIKLINDVDKLTKARIRTCYFVFFRSSKRND